MTMETQYPKPNEIETTYFLPSFLQRCPGDSACLQQILKLLFTHAPCAQGRPKRKFVWVKSSLILKKRKHHSCSLTPLRNSAILYTLLLLGDIKTGFMAAQALGLCRDVPVRCLLVVSNIFNLQIWDKWFHCSRLGRAPDVPLLAMAFFLSLSDAGGDEHHHCCSKWWHQRLCDPIRHQEEICPSDISMIYLSLRGGWSWIYDRFVASSYRWWHLVSFPESCWGDFVLNRSTDPYNRYPTWRRPKQQVLALQRTSPNIRKPSIKHP